jgi:hypothetical protein
MKKESRSEVRFDLLEAIDNCWSAALELYRNGEHRLADDCTHQARTLQGILDNVMSLPGSTFGKRD